MAITEIRSATFLADTVNLIRSNLVSKITDPISSKRPTGQRFVYTSYPKNHVTYPIITVTDRGISQPQRLGMGSQATSININVEIRIWARNVKERDELFGAIYDYLRINQLIGDDYVEANLTGFSLSSAVNVDEIGDEGIKSKVMEINYLVICS